MIIAIDNVVFQLQRDRFRGIAKVWANILPYMIMNWKARGYKLLMLDRDGCQPGSCGIQIHSTSRFVNGNTKDSTILDKICRDNGIGLFVSSYHTHTNLFKNVVMVHDLTPEKRGWVKGRCEYTLRRDAYLAASVLICVSESTKQDLLKFYPGIPHNRIHVVLEGVDPKIFHRVSAKSVRGFLKYYGINQNYIILDGDISIGVADKFCQAYQAQKCTDTLIWYGGALQKYMIDACERYGIIHKKLGWLLDSEVPVALSGAKGLIFISDAEGFGLPVLEAMACGTPVLCSKKTSLPEVGGDAVQYLQDTSVAGFQKSLKDFLEVNHRRELSAKGLVRAKQFSWGEMAKQIVEILG